MCKVSGCNFQEKKGRGGFCEKHYMRMYRNGTTETKRKASTYKHSKGYILVPANGHWLAKGASHAYEHRLVFHAEHGDGPFYCHWCGTSVTWKTLHIDHLDDDKTNNAIHNLVASCAICNQQRGRIKANATWRNRSGISAFGETLTLSEWSRRTGLSRASIYYRIKSGWPLERALSEPRGKVGPKVIGI